MEGSYFPDQKLLFSPELPPWREETLAELAVDSPDSVVTTREWDTCFVQLAPGHEKPFTREEVDHFGDYLGPQAARFNFRNYVGLSRFRGVPIEVVNRKITASQFRLMFDEVCRRGPELAFSLGTPAGFSWLREGEPSRAIPYHALLYLLKVFFFDELDVPSLFRLVHRNPHRVLLENPEEVPVSRATALRPSDLADLAARAERLARLRPGHPLGATSLARRFTRRGETWFPATAPQRRGDWTLDNRENRFLKYFFESLLDLVTDLEREFGQERKTLLNGDLSEQVGALKGILEEIVGDRFFEDVGDLEQIPWTSTVLTRRDGYRQLFRCFTELHSATTIQWNLPDFRQILEAKDIPTVYEYWVLFVLLDFLKNALGEPVGLSPVVGGGPAEARVPDGFEAHYRDGVVFRFQASRRSYSDLALRPDFLLTLGSRSLVLDAKYRKDGGDAAGEEETRFGFGTVKESDLMKMHAYRDAIPGVMGAWAVFPGEETRTYGNDAKGSRVGALALCPGAAEGNRAALAEFGEQLRWFWKETENT